MRFDRLLSNIIVRNLFGLVLLLAAHFIVDYWSFMQRSGTARFSPYIFLLMMYGWIVFHNRILFENFYRKRRRKAYFLWTSLAMTLCSVNMYYIISTSFQVRSPIPHIVSFWVYTIAGLGIYVIWKYVRRESRESTVTSNFSETSEAEFLVCNVDGETHRIPIESISYVESLENYVKIIRPQKNLLVRMSLKEAERKLPKSQFIRISKSHIINVRRIETNDPESITIAGQQLKIGKVYKKYVETFLKMTRPVNH